MASGGVSEKGWTTALGGSLPVPNVQALAASVVDEVPERYIRPEASSDIVDHATGEDEIPVIDMEKLLDPRFSCQEGQRLRFACENWGFFQLVNHGVPEQVIERMKADMGDFFRLPLEAKLEFSQPPGTVEGYGQAFVVSEKQKLDWSDMLYLYAYPPSARNFRLWPKQPPTFRDSLDEYSKELKKISKYMLCWMAKNLGLATAPEKLTKLFEEGFQGVRMTYYPPCPLANEQVLGISPHSDPVGLTLLLQVNEVPGLQIRKNGKWLPVKPLAGAFIANVGDVIEIASNGRYKSIEHRAVVSKDKERLSIATFQMSDPDGFVGPLPDLFQGNEQPRFKTVSSQEFMRLLFAGKLDGKSILEKLRLTS